MAVSLSFLIVKTILNVLASGKRKAFISACNNPEEAQSQILKHIQDHSLYEMPYSPVGYNFYEKRKVLTLDRVKFFETTSGSTGNKKEIPYTKTFLKTFEEMFLIWAHDLISHSGIDFRTGKFFMSISPKIGEKYKDDRKYLSAPVAILLKPFLASNPNNHSAKSGQDFLMKISKDLINSPDLEIISIWSPTYLLSVLQFMRENDVALNIRDKTWKEIWPELKLISCWTHAQAERPAHLLKEKFPGVTIQSKGLLMTEGAVTVPWSEANACVPLVNQAYFEFLDSNGKLQKLHEVKVGETYTLITSQLNGYLRYNTQDQVKITGFYLKTPTLEFVGRSGQYCDLAGEKFSENGLRELKLQQNFLILPDVSGELPRYHVYCESNDTNWDEVLKRIYHYNLARELNQLSAPVIHVVKNVGDLYLSYFQSQGMALGDIKERILLNDINLARKFLAWTDKELQSSH